MPHILSRIAADFLSLSTSGKLFRLHMGLLAAAGFWLLIPATIHAEDEKAPVSTVSTANNTTPPTPEEPHVFLNEGFGSYFSVYSYDPKSAAYVVNLGITLARWFENELKWDATSSNRPIRVELIPRVEATWTEPYRLNSNAGQMTLWIRWGNDTNWETFTRALAHAYLARVFQVNGSSQPVDAVPTWLIAALARELIVQTQPALLDAWTREAIQQQPLPLETFTDEKARPSFAPVLISDEKFSLQAFWFWRHLRREVAPQSGMIMALAKGNSLENILTLAKPNIWKNPDQKNLWWPIAYQQILRERTPTSMTLAESREYLADAARFVFSLDGVDKRLLAPELIAIRDIPAVKPEVARRQRLLKINISRANIVWHNAWRSYGVFLENFPTADEATLHKLWAAAQADAADATILEHEINRVLGE
ncbi:MAG: hypothetical protein LBV12_05225 [Puniceicoccales bacterium]|jgi:hypothetical protein|nr:hypothetical protein [Puniceicoccales bacterium]